jgi:hypothetical protein
VLVGSGSGCVYRIDLMDSLLMRSFFKRTYAHFLCFLLGGFGGDFGGFEGEGGEVVCC